MEKYHHKLKNLINGQSTILMLWLGQRRKCAAFRTPRIYGVQLIWMSHQECCNAELCELDLEMHDRQSAGVCDLVESVWIRPVVYSKGKVRQSAAKKAKEQRSQGWGSPRISAVSSPCICHYTQGDQIVSRKSCRRVEFISLLPNKIIDAVRWLSDTYWVAKAANHRLSIWPAHLSFWLSNEQVCCSWDLWGQRAHARSWRTRVHLYAWWQRRSSWSKDCQSFISRKRLREGPFTPDSRAQRDTDRFDHSHKQRGRSTRDSAASKLKNKPPAVPTICQLHDIRLPYLDLLLWARQRRESFWRGSAELSKNNLPRPIFSQRSLLEGCLSNMVNRI